MNAPSRFTPHFQISLLHKPWKDLISNFLIFVSFGCLLCHVEQAGCHWHMSDCSLSLKYFLHYRRKQNSEEQKTLLRRKTSSFISDDFLLLRISGSSALSNSFSGLSMKSFKIQLSILCVIKKNKTVFLENCSSENFGPSLFQNS